MAHTQAGLDRALSAIGDFRVFVAYNANVDAVVRVGPRLESYLERPDAPGERLPGGPLGSKRDLAAAITHTMSAGRGDEVAMTDDLAGTLETTLEPDKEQMGGQAGIMTNLLTALGAAPVTFTYLVSERQRELFHDPAAVEYPLVDDGAVSYVPLAEFVNTDRTKINWVFEFRKDDELYGVRAVTDTRFIAASRPPEFDLFAGELDDVIDQVGGDVGAAMLAGYHNLTPEHAEEGYDHTQRHAREVIRRLRNGGEIDIHIEYAVSHDEALRASMREWILPEADVLGMDGHEAAMLFEDAYPDAALDPPREDTPFDPEEVIQHYRMLTDLRTSLGVRCIRLHAMEYHLAVMERYLDPSAVLEGLQFAAVNAATKAATGSIDGPEDLEVGADVAPSAPGKSAIERLADELGTDVADGTLATPTVVACPNRVVRDPERTVGIGDIVSASSFLLEQSISHRSNRDR